MTQRPVPTVVDAIETLEGAGFVVHRPFPQAGLDMVDPFLLLDEMGPVDHEPGRATGAPDHPHRGFETVTYVLDGEFEHRDSVGGHGLIAPGGVQWMTAGAGVVHSEMPSEAFQRRGGRLHGFQLWVNLPADTKLSPPRYQERTAAEIPVADRDGARVRVIAGAFDGVEGAAATATPVTYLHASVEPGGELTVELPADHHAGVYVFEGRARIGSGSVGMRQLAVAPAAEGGLTIEAGPDGTELLVIAGRPIGEPVARYGPFVMNTREQLAEAVDDYQAGRMGTIAPVEA